MRLFLVSLVLACAPPVWAQQKIPPTQIASLSTCSTALQFSGTVFQCFGSAVGTVTSIATTSPILGGTISTSGTISCQAADTSHAGCLPSADWNTFNGKQAALSTHSGSTHHFLTSFTAPNTFADAQPIFGDIVGYWGGSAALDFGNIAAIGCEDLTISVMAAKAGDPVILGVPNASVPNGTAEFTAWVSADGTVTVRYCNLVSGDPASGTFKVSGINQ